MERGQSRTPMPDARPWLRFYRDVPATLDYSQVTLCQQRLIKWSCPREVEFRAELPRTLVGKIDYRKLVEESVLKNEPDRGGNARG
jgi:acyl-CoA synthetase (AMP-forming)/AMP-acid ligase II